MGALLKIFAFSTTAIQLLTHSHHHAAAARLVLFTFFDVEAKPLKDICETL